MGGPPGANWRPRATSPWVAQERRHRDAPLVTARASGVAARRQHGVVSAAQLRALGLGRDSVRRSREARRLLRIHRGVYAVGHDRLSARGRDWAAILAAGGPELLSHRSAAAVSDLTSAPGGAVEVTALGRSVDRPGVRVHRSATLDVVHHDGGLPVTSVTRTLVDLADVLCPGPCARPSSAPRSCACSTRAPSGPDGGAPRPPHSGARGDPR